MAQVTITQLPAAQPLTGTESVPISQNGQTVQTTVAAIANSPTQQQTFITVNQESTLPNSRRLQGGTGVGLTDTGALGTISIALNGASGSLEVSTNGMIAKTSGNTVVGRTLTGSGTGVAVTNGDGVAGNPVISLTGAVGSINGLAGSGLLTLQNGSSVGSVQITGTAGEVLVANGNGLSGNPTISLDVSGVTPGTYGSGTQVAQITVDSKGRITSATDVTITGSTDIVGGSANQLLYQSGANSTSFAVAPTVTDTFLKWDGSSFVWGAIAGAGTVTSVDVSGGATGLTTSGGPIIAAGTITLDGTLNVAHGGTGAVILTGYVKGNGTSAMTASATVPATDISGTLAVANGGTGAGSLTGYVKGNGTSAMTASATIPNTDITGLGTMSTQSASSVSITGGAIDGTTVGGTTPAAGTFTSVAMTTGTISTAPTNPNDIVNRAYADSIASGINFHQSVKYATTTALAANTYANGTAGVGATLTGNANGALTVDGYTFTSPADNGTRILVKNEGNAAHNGVYTLSQAGDAGNPYILTRATDFDSAGSGVDQIDAGDFFLVTAGTANDNTSWVQQTPLPITIGTTGIVFAQFGAPLVYSAGTGLTESPAYTFNIANTTVAAGNYGGAATAMTLSINAQGQITSATDVSIAISGSQITSGTVGSSYISGSYTGITGVGTLTAGTWNATTIGVAYGGTGLTSYAVGDLLYGSATTTLSKLALGTTGYVLAAGATTPEYVAQSTLDVGNAANVTTTAVTANATYYPAFMPATSGSNGVCVDSDMTYNPSTNTLTTGTVVATAGISGGTF